jgi:hypothetical protein
VLTLFKRAIDKAGFQLVDKLPESTDIVLRYFQAHRRSRISAQSLNKDLGMSLETARKAIRTLEGRKQVVLVAVSTYVPMAPDKYQLAGPGVIAVAHRPRRPMAPRRAPSGVPEDVLGAQCRDTLEFLRREFRDRDFTAAQVADAQGLSDATLVWRIRVLREHGFIRPHGEPRRNAMRRAAQKAQHYRLADAKESAH